MKLEETTENKYPLMVTNKQEQNAVKLIPKASNSQLISTSRCGTRSLQGRPVSSLDKSATNQVNKIAKTPQFPPPLLFEPQKNGRFVKATPCTAQNSEKTPTLWPNLPGGSSSRSKHTAIGAKNPKYMPKR